VVGSRNLTPEAAPEPPARVPSPPATSVARTDYRSWLSRTPSPGPLPVPGADAACTLSVIKALSGEPLAKLLASSSWTGADVKSRLMAEAPLAPGRGYRLAIGGRVLRDSDGLTDGEDVQVAAFVVPCWDPAADADVLAAIDGIGSSCGHLEKPAHQRDWEFFDQIPRPVELTLQVVCALLKTDMVEGVGPYSDYSAGTLPLLNPVRLADRVSQASFECTDIPDVLARIEPCLGDAHFGSDALRRVAVELNSPSCRRVVNTCIALLAWCQAVVAVLRRAS